MKELDCLLFDCDGTLIDTYDIILTSMRYAVNGLLGQDRSDEELMSKVGTPLQDQMLYFLDGDASRVDEMVAKYRAHNDAIHDEGVRSFPGVEQGLRALSDAGFKMGVVTSKRHFMADRGLELCGIRGFFDVLIGSDDFPIHKPEPAPILEGCTLMGAAPERTSYIGDSPYDIQAGNAAGTFTVAALWGMFPAASLAAEHPDARARDFAELTEMLLAMRG